jgi:hypothetical protein
MLKLKKIRRHRVNSGTFVMIYVSVCILHFTTKRLVSSNTVLRCNRVSYVYIIGGRTQHIYFLTHFRRVRVLPSSVPFKLLSGTHRPNFVKFDKRKSYLKNKLRAGLSRGSNPGGWGAARFSTPVQTGHDCSPSLLYNGYRVFPGGKAAGAWC